ncbi:glutamate receptor ionotropic, NMDA 1 [Elysia marginata]|uniref:Glutamate receptor ionotropic, NMDA 1 n=1 Tax=Elysia marginata TaxID=1093978 RepID=A0AAV4F7F4_9GAST|nr:glutamate receptor ionotropic, NMDA 1 [Elysia marginata]
MLNTTVKDGKEISFNQNGTLKRAELYILNLQWHDKIKRRSKWLQVGSWKRNGLTMDDITWPGESPIPPIGRPKRGFLRVATLNEKPYVMYRYPEKDNSCGETGLPCWIYPRDKDSRIPTSNVTEKRCCVGLTMDLLKLFSKELNFDFHIKEVEDGKWGALSKVT